MQSTFRPRDLSSIFFEEPGTIFLLERGGGFARVNTIEQGTANYWSGHDYREKLVE